MRIPFLTWDEWRGSTDERPTFFIKGIRNKWLILA